MSVTWQLLLDAYQDDLVRVEQALAEGREVPELDAYTPPSMSPSAVPTPGEVARFQELQQRAAACVEGIRAAMTRTAADLDASRRTGAAARAYGRMDHLTRDWR